jgi:Lar family restriction alleviation protein
LLQASFPRRVTVYKISCPAQFVGGNAMTDNRTTELLPCPFCGGEASKRLFYGTRYGVYCDECDARVGGLFLTEAEAIAAWNARAERTCECIEEYAESPLDGKTIVLHRCSACHELMRPHMRYCPNCGCKVVGA